MGELKNLQVQWKPGGPLPTVFSSCALGDSCRDDMRSWTSLDDMVTRGASSGKYDLVSPSGPGIDGNAAPFFVSTALAFNGVEYLQCDAITAPYGAENTQTGVFLYKDFSSCPVSGANDFWFRMRVAFSPGYFHFNYNDAAGYTNDTFQFITGNAVLYYENGAVYKGLWIDGGPGGSYQVAFPGEPTWLATGEWFDVIYHTITSADPTLNGVEHFYARRSDGSGAMRDLGQGGLSPGAANLSWLTGPSISVTGATYPGPRWFRYDGYEAAQGSDPFGLFGASSCVGTLDDTSPVTPCTNTCFDFAGRSTANSPQADNECEFADSPLLGYVGPLGWSWHPSQCASFIQSASTHEVPSAITGDVMSVRVKHCNAWTSDTVYICPDFSGLDPSATYRFSFDYSIIQGKTPSMGSAATLTLELTAGGLTFSKILFDLIGFGTGASGTLTGDILGSVMGNSAGVSITCFGYGAPSGPTGPREVLEAEFSNFSLCPLP